MSLNEITNNITNIKSTDKNTISLSKVLIIFYMAIMANLSTGIISKQLKTYIANNRMIQHLICFITLYIIIAQFSNIQDNKIIFIYSAIIYIWFIFTTKLSLTLNIIVMLLLFAGYMFEHNLDINEIKNIKMISDDEQKELINKNNYYKKIIVFAIFSVTIFGTLLYNDKKHIQYGGGYSLLKYLFY